MNKNRPHARKWVRLEENVYPKSVGLNHPFSTTSQFNGNFNDLYVFRTKHNIRNRASALETSRGSYTVLKNHELWSIGPEFLPALYKFCILHHCQVSQTEISQRKLTQTLPNGRCKSRWQSAVEKSGSSLPKMGQKLLHLFDFFDDFET